MAVVNKFSKAAVGFQRNVDLTAQIKDLAGFTIGPAAPTQTPPTTTTGPAAPTGPSLNLQALLAAIPIAQDGQVITAEYHNSLRSALIALASELGLGLSSPTTTFSFAPAFLP